MINSTFFFWHAQILFSFVSIHLSLSFAHKYTGTDTQSCSLTLIQGQEKQSTTTATGLETKLYERNNENTGSIIRVKSMSQISTQGITVCAEPETLSSL